jgi:hypothetical protein
MLAACAIGLLGLALLAGAVIYAWRRGAAWRLGAFGLVWYGVGITLSVLFLAFHYVIDAPRLMYLPSAGAALVWAFVINAVFSPLAWTQVHVTPRPPLPSWERESLRLLAAAVILVAVAGGAWFVQGRMALYNELGAFYDTASDELAAADGSAVFINAPAWAAYKTPVFALGHEGVALMAEYMDLESFVWANTGTLPDVETTYLGERVRETSYWVGYLRQDTPPAADFEGASAVYQAVAVDDAFMLYGARLLDAAPQREPLATFDNGVTLAGGEVAGADGSADLRVSLTLRADRPFTETIFIHVLCDGALVAQADGHTLGVWPPGESWLEFREVKLPAGASPGCVSVQAGFYDGASGARSPARDAAGAAISGDAVPLPLAYE